MNNNEGLCSIIIYNITGQSSDFNSSCCVPEYTSLIQWRWYDFRSIRRKRNWSQTFFVTCTQLMMLSDGQHLGFSGGYMRFILSRILKPFNRLSSKPVCASHIVMVISLEPDTILWPSLLQLMDVTNTFWFWISWISMKALYWMSSAVSH
jgi:hypothetical protein